MHLRLTGCRWRVEGDLRTVGAEHGVPAASYSEGVQTVRLQVTHHGAGAVHSVCGPPDTIVLTIFLGWGLAWASKSGEKLYFSFKYLQLIHGATHPSTPKVMLALTCGTQACGDQ